MKAEISIADLTHAMMFLDDLGTLAERAVENASEEDADTIGASFSLAAAAMLHLIKPWFTDEVVDALTRMSSSDVAEIIKGLYKAKNDREYRNWYRFSNDLWTVCREVRDSVAPIA